MSERNAMELKQIWEELESVILGLPEDQRVRIQQAFGVFLHDARSALGIIYSSEGLLRETMPVDSADLNLLDMIHSASKRMVSLLSDLAPYVSKE